MLSLCGVLLALTGCVVTGPNGLPVVVLPQVVAAPVVVNAGYYGTPAGYYYRNYPIYNYNGRACYYANGNRYWYGGGGGYYGHRNYYANVNYRNGGYYGNHYYGNRYYNNRYYGNRY